MSIKVYEMGELIQSRLNSIFTANLNLLSFNNILFKYMIDSNEMWSIIKA